MKQIFAVASLAILLGSAPVMAQAKTPEKKQSAKTANADDSKIRCREIQQTGSLVRSTKVCKTLAEWRQINEQGNRAARAILENNQICPDQTVCGGS
ncbi:hypothetical protein C7451_102272 [Blastomonas natatoria]|uniref:Secreted protein n=2 Tax=Blastomonas natatoria TaxID=34015 RepID=A0A2V3VAJ8_9SPHN|nr:hypothetical protein C7451_102272 [Blastomonas natatoria]